MSDPKMIKGIQDAVSIPVMAKCRIGHFVEAQLLEAIEIDYIDESEVLSPADDVYHIDKTKFRVPFVCGAKDLGEALRRINEGASMIRTKGEPGTGDIVQPASAWTLSDGSPYSAHADRNAHWCPNPCRTGQCRSSRQSCVSRMMVFIQKSGIFIAIR